MFFSEVPKVDLTRFGNKLFNCKVQKSMVFHHSYHEAAQGPM